MKVLATKQPQKITFIPQHGVMLEHGSQELYVIQHRQPVEIGLIIKAPKFSNKEQFPAFLCNGLENETPEILNKLVIERIKGYFQDSENVVAENYLNSQDIPVEKLTTQGKLGGNLNNNKIELLQKERPQAPPPKPKVQWDNLEKWFNNRETTTKTDKQVKMAETTPTTKVTTTTTTTSATKVTTTTTTTSTTKVTTTTTTTTTPTQTQKATTWTSTIQTTTEESTKTTGTNLEETEHTPLLVKATKYQNSQKNHFWEYEETGEYEKIDYLEALLNALETTEETYRARNKRFILGTTKMTTIFKIPTEKAQIFRTTAPIITQPTVTKSKGPEQHNLWTDKIEVKPSQWAMYNVKTGDNRIVRPDDKYKSMKCCETCKANNNTLQIRTVENTVKITLTTLVEVPQTLVYDVYVIIFVEQPAIQPAWYDIENAWNLKIGRAGAENARKSVKHLTPCTQTAGIDGKFIRFLRSTKGKNEYAFKLRCVNEIGTDELLTQMVKIELQLSENLCANTNFYPIRLTGKGSETSTNNRKRRQAIAASIGFIGGGLFNYFLGKHTQQRPEQLTKEVNLLEENVINFDKDVLEDQKKLFFRMETDEKLIASINSAICQIADIEEELQKFIIIGDMAKKFIELVRAEVESIHGNIPGNAFLKAAQKMCEGKNKASRFSPRKIADACRDYLQNALEIKITSAEIEDNEGFAIKIHAKAVIPRLVYQEAKIIFSHTIPIPAAISKGVTTFRTLQSMPAKIVYLQELNQIVSGDDSCTVTEKRIFCNTDILYIYDAKSRCAQAIMGNETNTAVCDSTLFNSKNNCIIKSLENAILVSNSEKIMIEDGTHNEDLPVHTVDNVQNELGPGTHRILPKKNFNIRCLHTAFYVDKRFYDLGETKSVNLELNHTVFHSDYSTITGIFDMLAHDLTEQRDFVGSIKHFNDSNLMEMAQIVADRSLKLKYIPNSFHNKLYKYGLPIVCATTLLLILFLIIKSFYRTCKWAYEDFKYKMSKISCKCCPRNHRDSGEYEDYEA